MYTRGFSRKIAKALAGKVNQSQHRNLILIVFHLALGLFLLGVAIYNFISRVTPDPTTRWIGITICLVISFFSLYLGITLLIQTRKYPEDK